MIGKPPTGISGAYGATVFNPDPWADAYALVLGSRVPSGAPSVIPGTVGVAGPAFTNLGPSQTEAPKREPGLVELIAEFVEKLEDRIADKVAAKVIAIVDARTATPYDDMIPEGLCVESTTLKNEAPMVAPDRSTEPGVHENARYEQWSRLVKRVTGFDTKIRAYTTAPEVMSVEVDSTRMYGFVFKASEMQVIGDAYVEDNNRVYLDGALLQSIKSHDDIVAALKMLVTGQRCQCFDHVPEHAKPGQWHHVACWRFAAEDQAESGEDLRARGVCGIGLHGELAATPNTLACRLVAGHAGPHRNTNE